MKRPDPTPVGARLRELRLARGLSQTAAAELAGMTQNGVSGLELGRYEPGWDVVRRLAAAYGASLGDLDGCE